MSQAEDMQAIRDYIAAVPTKTPEAAQQRTNFLTWYDGLSFLDRTLSDDALANAKAKRNAFDQSNVTTLAEQIAVQRVQNPKEVAAAEKQVAGYNVTGALPVLRRGSKGEAVKKWQRIIGVKDDGDFGSGTEAKTKVWQAQHGTSADGVVGTSSWTIALGKQNGGKVPPAVMANIPTRAATKEAMKQTSAEWLASTPTTGVKGAAGKAVKKVQAAEQAIARQTESVPLWVKIVGVGVLLTGGVAAYNEFTKSHVRRKAA